MTDKKSQYRNIFGARGKMDPEPEPEPRQEAPPPAPVEKERPVAKSKDPDYVQALAYIKRDTYGDVKSILLKEKLGRDYSDLVQALLERYVEENEHLLRR